MTNKQLLKILAKAKPGRDFFVIRLKYATPENVVRAFIDLHGLAFVISDEERAKLIKYKPSDLPLSLHISKKNHGFKLEEFAYTVSRYITTIIIAKFPQTP